jgi:hypothetical protein
MYKKLIFFLFVLLLSSICFAENNLMVGIKDGNVYRFIGGVVNSVNGETGDVTIDSTTLINVPFLDVENTFTKNNNFTSIVATTVTASNNAGLYLLEDGGSGLFVEDSSGNVGIGTTSPTEKFEVFGGNIKTSSSVITTEVKALDASGLKIYNDDSTKGLFIKDNGNVGIGTIIPAYPFAIFSSSNVGLMLESDSVDGTWALFKNNSAGGKTWANFTAGNSTSGIPVGAYTIRNDSDDINAFTILSNGYIGLNTTNPSTNLHVSRNVATTSTVEEVVRIERLTTGTASNGIGGALNFYTENSGGSSILTGNIKSFIDVTGENLSLGNDGEIIRIDGQGFVGVGDNSPDEKLDVSGNIIVGNDVGKKLRIIPDSAGTTYMQIGASGGDQTGILRFSSLFTTGTNINAFQVYASTTYLSGNVGIGVQNPLATLDINGTVAYGSNTTLLVNSSTITVTNTYSKISGNGSAVTLTSTPSIADGTDGQIVILKGDNDTNTVTLQDESSLSNSGLQLEEGVNFTLGKGDILQLIYDATDDKWIEISRGDN